VAGSVDVATNAVAEVVTYARNTHLADVVQPLLYNCRQADSLLGERAKAQ